MSTPEELREKVIGIIDAYHNGYPLDSVEDMMNLLDAESRARSVEELEKIENRPGLYDAPNAFTGTYLDGIRDGVTQERESVKRKISQAISRLTDGA